MSDLTKKIDPARTAVVFIEFQREWLAADGKLNNRMQDRPQFEAAIAGGRALLEYGRQKRLTIVHSGLRFSPGYPELGENGLGMRRAMNEPRSRAPGHRSYGKKIDCMRDRIPHSLL
jgi:nicotinamidase-related amidase